MDSSQAAPGSTSQSNIAKPSQLQVTSSIASITTTGTGKPTTATPMHYVKALYDFAAKEQEELPMEEEDIIAVPSMVSKSGWLFGENNGAWGWFPESYVRGLTEEEAGVEGFMVVQGLAPAVVQENTHESATNGLISPPPEPSMESSSPTRQQPLSTAASTGWFTKYKPRSKKPTPDHESTEDASPDLPTDSRSRSNSEKPVHRVIIKPKAKFSADSIRSGKGVSIVGTPAEVKKTWTEVMGGFEAVERLDISKGERKRQEVIFEMVSTERDFVDDLNVIIEVYIKQLKRTKLVRPKDMSVVFSNIEAITPVNRELLKSLEARQSQSPNGVVEQVGDILIGVSDYLKMYTMYCSNHPYALMKLQALRNSKAVAKFLDQCAASPDCKNLALSHFLLKPVQRICKYPLLLREIIRNTDVDHPDSANLQKALMKIETVVTIVNEGARQAEVVHKMIELQNRFTQRVNIVAPSRTLKKSGTLNTITPQNDSKPREIFLFNDMLIMAKPFGSDHEKLKLVAMVPFDMILINSLPEDRGNLIEIVHINAAKFTLEAESNEVKEAWVNAFQDATDSWMALKKRGAGIEVQERVLRTLAMSDISDKPVLKSAPPLPKNPSEAIGDNAAEGHEEQENVAPCSVEESLHQKALSIDIQPNQATTKLTPNEFSLAVKPQIEVPTQTKSLSSSTNSMATDDVVDSAVHLSPPKSINSIADQSTEPSKADTVSSQSRLDSSPIRLSSRLATNYFIVQDLNSSRLHPTATHARSITVEAPAVICSSASSISPSSSFSNRVNAQITLSPSNGASTPSISPSSSFQRPLATASRPVKAGPMDLNRKPNVPSFISDKPGVTRNLTASRPRTKSISEKPDEAKLALVAPRNGLRNSASSMESAKADGGQKAAQLSTKKPNINRPVKFAAIADVTRKNSKDFVYTLHVQYTGQAEPNILYIIQHTYEDFFDFHLQLIGHFPEEAGVSSGKKDVAFKSLPDNEAGSKRIIPELPGQMMVVSEAVAKTRIDMLQSYIQVRPYNNLLT
ncbi:Myosin 10A, isoform D [Dinochytrium kinnereticum]|nr:Myosin 10A, isoform D [Dinochytrium kinnereticum]